LLHWSFVVQGGRRCIAPSVEAWYDADMSKTAGYSGTPLVRKLGIKAGFTICVVHRPHNYWHLLRDLPENVSVRDLGAGPFDLIHVFARDKVWLEERMATLKASIVPAGMIWASWPKKASKVPTDLNENVIRDLALEHGLVDTKVIAVDETWSGLKLVIRLKDREQR
jgi:hypothetical protein